MHVHVGFQSGLGVEVLYEYLGMYFSILNIYWPYVEWVILWNALIQESFLESEVLILGGDLNFYIGETRVSGPRVRIDHLSNNFRQIMVKKCRIDVAPDKLNPTWQDKRIGDDRIVKRLDWFLIFDKLIKHPLQFRKWIGSKGECHDSPIFLEVVGGMIKPMSPFKFNLFWIKEEIFQTLVKYWWIPFDPLSREAVQVQFVTNIK
jgi:hypothetical protein